MDVDLRYARSGGLRIAYATFGEGPIDFVFVPGFVSHLENWWEVNASARFFRRIASFSGFDHVRQAWDGDVRPVHRRSDPRRAH